MDSQPPAAVPTVFDLAENEIAEMTGAIRTLAKDLKGIKASTKRMAIFADRTGKDGKLKPKSQVELDTSPEEELLYEHRKLYEETVRVLPKVMESLESIIPDAKDVRNYYHSLQLLRSMIGEAKDHLKEMAKIQLMQRQRESSLETKVIAVVEERAKMVARLLEHKDKMEIARKTSDAPTTTQLNERLASKYGMSIEEVDKLIAAKQADADVRP